MTIPVQTSEVLLPVLSRQLSVLKHIQLAVPPADRWYAVFNRYVDHFNAKVKALGGDPVTIAPSAAGTGTLDTDGAPSWTLCLTPQWFVTLLLAVLCVVVALLPTSIAAITATVLVVALLAACSFWVARCRPSVCSWVATALIGLNVAAAILCLVYLLAGISTSTLLTIISILGILNFGLLTWAVLKKCFKSS